MVVDSSFTGDIYSCVSDKHEGNLVTCLLGSRVTDLTRCLDELVDRAGESSMVVGHVGSKDVGKRCFSRRKKIDGYVVG